MNEILIHVYVLVLFIAHKIASPNNADLEFLKKEREFYDELIGDCK